MRKCGGWLAVAQEAVIDTMHALLSPASLDETSVTLSDASSPSSRLLVSAAQLQAHPWPGDVPGDVLPARWLFTCVQMLRPLADTMSRANLETLPRARALAMLLSASEKPCAPPGLPALLKMLWSWYAKYLPIDAQAEMEAHALVAATAVPCFHCETAVAGVDEHDPLARVEAAAKALAKLHEETLSKERLPELLELLIARGMRWAFAQSHSAISQGRGVWVDIALTPFLRLCDDETCEKVGRSLSYLRSSVENPPAIEEFDAVLDQRLDAASAQSLNPNEGA